MLPGLFDHRETPRGGAEFLFDGVEGGSFVVSRGFTRTTFHPAQEEGAGLFDRLAAVAFRLLEGRDRGGVIGAEPPDRLGPSFQLRFRRR